MSTATITRDEAFEMMAQAFQVSASELTPERPRDSLPDWDSMGALLLMAEIDERFGIELTAEESLRMTRVADVLDFLQRNGVLQG